MAKGKLILICQSGGEFVKNDDGSLKYNGGEAQAVNIDGETLFDDLKLKLAEVSNLEFKSVAIKYFLPGNTRTLINLSNDKELKRMLDFHGKSVTAEVFVTGREGFNRDAFILDTRETGVKVAESVKHVVPATASPIGSAPGKNTARKKVTAGRKRATITKKPATATRKKAIPTARVTKRKTSGRRKTTAVATESVIGVDATSGGSIGGTTASNTSDDSDSDFSDYALRSLVAAATEVNASSSNEIDMSASPADTVKKRRRIASWRFGANGPTIVTVPNGEITERPRKRKRQRQSLVVDEELEQIEESGSEDDDFNISDPIHSNDGSLAKLVASWKKGITGIGQDFNDVSEFRDTLQKYAIARRFVYKLKKNETTRVSARCVIESCSWKIFASWVPTDHSFRIKTFNKSHSCGGESWKSAHPNRTLFVNFIKEWLKNSPRQKVKDIANSISRDFGLELNLSQVRRGINDAREQLQGSYKEAYNQLYWYCDKIVQANPMSFVKLETDEEKRFERLFISFHASIHGFESGCRPLLFLEATSLRSKCKEKLLTATALDGNDGLFPVAFGIVNNENNDSWRWFLEVLRSALPTSGSITFVSDREKGLKETVNEVFENAYFGYSIYHLLQGFMRSVKRPFQGNGRSSLPGYLIAAAQSIRLSGFRHFMEQIKKVSSEGYDWLMQVEPEYWTCTSFKGEPYNHITQNVADSVIKLMEDKRESTITHKIEALIYMMSELINTRRTESTTWSSKLTPPKQEKLREEFVDARGLKVLFSCDTLIEVRDEVSHVVDLKINECTCLVWQKTGIPCRHAIAVFNCTSRNIYDYCSRYFTAETFRLTYSKSISPVDKPAEVEESDPDNVVMFPPRPSRSWSQPRKKQSKRLRLTEKVDSSSGCNEEGQAASTFEADPEVIGEGNLIAAFDANGEVGHEVNEAADRAAGLESNGDAPCEDDHEDTIEASSVASLDATVEPSCEEVRVNTEANCVASAEDISKASCEGEPKAVVEANRTASLEANGDANREAEHEFSGEATHVAALKANGEGSYEADPNASVEATGGASLEVNNGAASEAIVEAPNEAT